MNIQLSEHFNYKKLIKFTLPSMIMMIFTSLYGMVDGFFVSNFVGKTSFAAVNFIIPFTMLLGAIGFMIGTGGSAIVSKTFGEGKIKEAKQYFSMFTLSTVILGVTLMIAGLIAIRPLSIALGAEGELLEEAVLYGSIILTALPAFMLQNVFQSFFVTAEKPQIGLYVTIVAGFTNIALDYILIVIFPLGIAGAAIATAISQLIGGIVPIFYFFKKNSSLLHFTKAVWNGKVFSHGCINGSSELMTNISMSIVGMLYNVQLMKIAGENGLAAYGVIMYVSFIFVAIYIGYSIGTAPIIGYHYGAENPSEVKNILKKSVNLMVIIGLILTILGMLLAKPLSMIFVGYDAELLDMTSHGLIIYSFSFLTMGLNIFASSFFTALNNGFVSAAISFLRTLLFQVIVVLILPMLLGLTGIWLAVVVAELLALAVSIAFIVNKRSVYGY